VTVSLKAIPTYALYGEAAETPMDLWVHCESIPVRSALFDWEIALHRHRSFFQILHMSCGAGAFRVGTDEYAIGPSVLLTVPPRAVHGFRFSENVEGSVVTVRVERIEQMLSTCPGIRAFFTSPRVLDLSGLGASAAPLARHVETIAAETAASREGRWALVEANLTMLLIEMARAMGAAAAGTHSGSFNRRAGQFQALVDRHFRDERAVAFYADKLGVSETHLNRIVRAAFAQSALGMINQRLVGEAARDLIFTPLPVKQIAEALGFEDPAYFTRFFTKQTGMPPTKFRAEQARRSGED
jgi:AraC family transcriptional activator of pobA